PSASTIGANRAARAAVRGIRRLLAETPAGPARSAAAGRDAEAPEGHGTRPHLVGQAPGTGRC
ncbi:pyridine nucleotide-disulfide oxidoreductase, partial [Streptomyces noursei]